MISNKSYKDLSQFERYSDLFEPRNSKIPGGEYGNNIKLRGFSTSYFCVPILRQDSLHPEKQYKDKLKYKALYFSFEVHVLEEGVRILYVLDR